MNLGDKIKKLRKEQNLSQEQLAEKLNISRQAVSKWESGKAYPDIENLKVLKGIFNISIDELVMDEDLIETIEENEEDDLPTKLMLVGFFIGMGIGLMTDNFIWGTAACFIGLGVGELIECIRKSKNKIQR